MTISTMAALQAALPGRTLPFASSFIPSNDQSGVNLASYWLASGAVPPTGAGAVPTSATAGAVAGLVAPAAGNTLYLARARAWAAQQAGAAVLLDRLVHTSGLSGTVTTAQTVNSAAVDRPDATGSDAHLYLEWYTGPGSNPATATVSYTNQAGVSGQIGTLPLLGTSSQHMMQPVPLASGDTGVRSVQSVTLSTSLGSAGNFGVTIARPVAWVPLVGLNAMSGQDHFELGLPALPSNACLFFATSRGSSGSNGLRLAELTTIEG